LHFGSQSRKAEIDEELIETFTLENRNFEPVFFKLRPEKSTNVKYRLWCDPDEGTVKPGEVRPVKAHLVVRCTTVLRTELALDLQTKSSAVRALSSSAGTASPLQDLCVLRIPVNVETKLTTKLDFEELKFSEPPIGKGATGAVFRGEWRGQEVAIKVLGQQVGTVAWQMQEFEQEVAILDQLRSPFVVHFFGAVHQPGKLCMVMEYFPLGNLVTAMAADPFSLVLKLKCALDCIRAMRFIHASGIIHRDLKPANLLVMSRSLKAAVSCKLGDFGATRDIGSEAKDLTKGVGTPTYMAPEVIASGDYKLPADVYSFGVLLWFLVAEKTPYADMATAWAVTAFVMSGKRLAIPASCPPDIAATITSCWSQKPEARPTFSVLFDTMEPIFKRAEAEYRAAKKKK
jgi:predicted Ser/Thr protein kinase